MCWLRPGKTEWGNHSVHMGWDLVQEAVVLGVLAVLGGRDSGAVVLGVLRIRQ
jgi:hypothetical protein